jgi:hypothetical protein
VYFKQQCSRDDKKGCQSGSSDREPASKQDALSSNPNTTKKQQTKNTKKQVISLKTIYLNFPISKGILYISGQNGTVPSDLTCSHHSFGGYHSHCFIRGGPSEVATTTLYLWGKNTLGGKVSFK